MVNFYVSYKENGEPVTKKIKSRTHMVNPGARVVADLYQYEDGKKRAFCQHPECAQRG